jgi:hypothetical protein
VIITRMASIALPPTPTACGAAARARADSPGDTARCAKKASARIEPLARFPTLN